MPLSKEGLKKTAIPKDVFQFRDGDNTVRILPPTMDYFSKDIDIIGYRFACHYNIGPEGSPPVVCPRGEDTKEEKHRCPICEAGKRLRRNPATKEIARDIGSRTRYLLNVVDMEHPERGIQVAEVGPSIYDKIFEVAIDRDYGDILDLKTGRNFKITLTPANRSKSGYNSYSVLAGANPSSVKEILPKGWQDKISELAGRVGVPPSIEELSRLASEATGGQAVSGDGNIEPTPPRNARTSKARASEEFVAIGQQDSVVKEGSDGSPSDDVGSGGGDGDDDNNDTPAAAKQTAGKGSKKAADEGSAKKAADEGSAKKATGAPEGASECWGNDFQPSEEKCKACAHRESCMKKYLEG